MFGRSRQLAGLMAAILLAVVVLGGCLTCVQPIVAQTSAHDCCEPEQRHCDESSPEQNECAMSAAKTANSEPPSAPVVLLADSSSVIAAPAFVPGAITVETSTPHSLPPLKLTSVIRV